MRSKTVCARGAEPATSSGRSTSPLDDYIYAPHVRRSRLGRCQPLRLNSTTALLARGHALSWIQRSRGSSFGAAGRNFPRSAVADGVEHFVAYLVDKPTRPQKRCALC